MIKLNKNNRQDGDKKSTSLKIEITNISDREYKSQVITKTINKV